jgi:hypothetical protein
VRCADEDQEDDLEVSFIIQNPLAQAMPFRQIQRLYNSHGNREEFN